MAKEGSRTVLRTSYVTRVEGCAGPSSVQRLLFVTAGGAAAAQGVVRCISNFAEEVARGGFLAAVEGYVSRQGNGSVSDSQQLPSISQLWFVWAVPVNATQPAPDPPLSETSFSGAAVLGQGLYGTGGVEAVAPRLVPVVPTPECNQARPLIPAGQAQRGGSECGSFNAQGYACPSFMCCGAARGRVGLCGTLASSCLLSSCDPSYGLCGVVPSETLEVSVHEGIRGVAPAPAQGPPVAVGGSADDVITSTVRAGRTVYSIDKLGSYTYGTAVDQCRSQRLFGLAWRILALEDAMAFEVSLLARTPFLLMLDNRVAWVRPSRNISATFTPPCLTVSWQVDEGNVQMVAVQAADCSITASVICKADWPVLGDGEAQGSTETSDGASWPALLNSPPPPVAATNNTRTVFTPGPHALSFSLIGIGNPNSGPNCTFRTVDDILDEQGLQDWRTRGATLITAASGLPSGTSSITNTAAVPLNINTTISRAIVGVAMRPLLVWSAVAAELPLSFEALGGFALQYTSRGPQGSDEGVRVLDGLQSLSSPLPGSPPPPASVPRDAPMVLGSLDGTYLSANASFGAAAPPPSIAATANTMAYLSRSAGWRSFELDAAAGEVVVEVTGCRGALVEELVFRTSTGRLWTAPAGLGLVCSVPYRFTAPSGGYLVAVQAHAGSYIEEVALVWGTPIVPPAPPVEQPVPSGGRTAPAGGGDDAGPEPGVIAAAVAVGVGVPLVVALLAGVWWVRRHRGTGGGPAKSGSDGAAPGVAAAAASCSAPAETELSSVVIEGVAAGAHPKAATNPVAIGVSAATSPSGSSASDAAVAGAAAVAVGTAVALSSHRGSSEQRGPYHAIAATLGTGTSSIRSAEEEAAALAVTVALVTSGEATSTASGGALRPQPPPPTRVGSSGSAAQATAALAAAVAVPGQGQARGHVWAMPGSHPHASGPGQLAPVAPAKAEVTDQSAWAQSLHDALFHKVLYWQTPVSGSPRLGQGVPLAASTAGLATPLAAPMAALHLLSEAGGQGAGPVLSPASSGARQPPLTAPAPAQQRWGSGASGEGAAGASASASGESRPAPSAGSGATGAGAAAANGVGAGSSGGAAGPQRSGGGSGSAAGGAGSEAPAAAGPAGSGSGGALARTVSPPASQAAANAAGGAGRGSGGSGGAGGSGTAPGSGAAAASPALVGPSAAAAPPAGPAAAVAGLGRELPPRPMPPVVPGPSGTAVHTAATGVKVLSGPSEAAELLLGRDVVVDLDDPSTYLGHGTSGVVRRGLLRTEEGGWMQVAVKLLNRPNDQAVDTYRRHLKTLLQEITILGSLCHPNVVRLLGGSVSLASGESFLVEELCGSTLSHAIYDEATPYSLASVLRWCTDIARGLAYLHPNIMHRDLKPSNVLLDAHGVAKISDFGLARFKLHTTLVTRDAEVGTTCYMSPECFVSSDFKVTTACDVYSLGVMMNELCTRQRPWIGVRTAVVGFKVAVVGDRPKLAREGHPLCPPPLRQLIQDCWAQQPQERPSSAQVLSRLEGLLAELEAAEAEGRQAWHCTPEPEQPQPQGEEAPAEEGPGALEAEAEAEAEAIARLAMAAAARAEAEAAGDL
ncbi:hypothetical protein HYH03_002560 [Edaphochlamys debaryana]|uniref:Protein kinase domain-containing protein n=1 Tax=Edaphochlamys debaryana TaxID=47281 RepID=A0A835YBK5_9CHLO|nr:hypothetical protein HYH03_002560 [Edaphochlamys debaryana]|eukprot:KAG2499621.1 hypothetical protein HYH03_002560 [Edaphochlamys debaryana]